MTSSKRLRDCTRSTSQPASLRTPTSTTGRCRPRFNETGGTRLLSGPSTRFNSMRRIDSGVSRRRVPRWAYGPTSADDLLQALVHDGDGIRQLTEVGAL